MIDIKYMEKLPGSDNTNGGSLYLSNGILYKFYDSSTSFVDEKERNVSYMLVHNWFSPLVLEMYYDNGKFVGYSQEYIYGSKTFEDGINDSNLNFDIKIKFVKDVFNKLRILHQHNILVGDMHLRNLIYNGNEAYIIDLDEIRFKGIDDFKFEDNYLIKPNSSTPHIKVASEYTDNIKTTIACLSLLFNFNLESFADSGILCLTDIEDWLYMHCQDKELLDRILNVLKSKDKIVYFDSIFDKSNIK